MSSAEPPAAEAQPASSRASVSRFSVSLPRFLLVTEYHATLFRHFWRGSIVTIFVSPVLYLLAMGQGVGSLVDANTAATESALGGTRYLHYVAPGLMAAAAMQAGVSGSLYPVLASVKWLRTAFGLAATPVRPTDISAGLLCWLGIQITFAATVFVAIMAVAGAISSPWVVLAPLAATLGGLAYAAPLSAWAVGRESENSFALIFRVGILPSFLLSGTFFPLSQLPGPLQLLAAATPLWHSVELTRGFTTGDFELGSTVAHLVVPALYVTVGSRLSAQQYAKRLYP